MEMATDFQDLLTQAVNTSYTSNDIFAEKTELKLITKWVDRNDCFAKDMRLKGHYYKFVRGKQALGAGQGEDEDEDEQEEAERTEDLDDNNQGTDGVALHPRTDDGAGTQVRTTYTPPDLEELLQDPECVSDPIREDIINWLNRVYKTSRGLEIGTFQSSILPNSFKMQTIKWEALAMGYVSDSINIAHDFTTTALDVICPNARVREALKSHLLPQLIEKYNKAIEHAQLVLQIERNEPPLTLNHYFSQNLEKSRDKRSQDKHESSTLNGATPAPAVATSTPVSAYKKAQESRMSNREHTIREIHDILDAYYKVAFKRFVDNMCMQAAGHFLITGSSTPLKLFSATFVGSLTEEQLKLIAGEDPAAQQKRKRLQDEITDLEKGRKILF